jgi:hypothetical protein
VRRLEMGEVKKGKERKGRKEDGHGGDIRSRDIQSSERRNTRYTDLKLLYTTLGGVLEHRQELQHPVCHVLRGLFS